MKREADTASLATNTPCPSSIAMPAASLPRDSESTNSSASTPRKRWRSSSLLGPSPTPKIPHMADCLSYSARWIEINLANQRRRPDRQIAEPELPAQEHIEVGNGKAERERRAERCALDAEPRDQRKIQQQVAHGDHEREQRVMSRPPCLQQDPIERHEARHG